MASLRTRLLLGAVLWTIGLFVGAVLLSTVLMLMYPRYPVFLHRTVYTFMTAAIVLIVLCLAAGFVLVRSGVSPINQLRARLSLLHAGLQRQIDGVYPSEVQPLVDDLNSLLAHREQMVQRAIAKAGDLAHGLKTPLAVLAHDAERAAAAGQHELAGSIQQQVERMRRQMDYHLAHARAAASGATPGAQCAVAASVDGLVRTLQRLHTARGLAIDVSVPPDHTVRTQREDLDEMLGNLLDNACKWATSRVSISSTQNGHAIVMAVDDDGPGIAEEMRDAVLQRGVRADEAAPGTGFGLAIVRDLAELYGGSIALDRSSLGGLRARLLLPAAS